MEKGIKEGMKEGMKEGKLEIAKSMRADGISFDIIEKYTGISQSEIV